MQITHRDPIATTIVLVHQLVRQFDSVGMFPVTLVLVSQDLFEPLCLLFCCPHIYGLGVVANEELLAATLAAQCSHLLEPDGFFPAAFSDCHRSHGLILDELAS
jgi:hypothetical protein